MCPILHEEPIQQVSTTGMFPSPAQHKYDPYANTYNPGWRDHPNLSYGTIKSTKIIIDNLSNLGYQEIRVLVYP